MGCGASTALQGVSESDLQAVVATLRPEHVLKLQEALDATEADADLLDSYFSYCHEAMGNK